MEFFGYLVPLVRKQVGICVKGSFYFLMPQAVGNGQGRKAHFNQQAGVAVANVMHPDALYPRCLAAMVQKALGVGKQPIIILQSASLVPRIISCSKKDLV